MAYKILVVEDEALLGQSVQEAMEEAGFKVEWASSGAGVWQILGSFEADLILLDIMLPGDEDGYDILRKLRTNKGMYGNPVIVMMTNLGQIGEMDRAMELGADDYVIKANIDLARLVDLVKEKLAVLKAKK